MILTLAAAAVSFLLLSTCHWLCQQLFHGEMRLLWRYALGTAAIGAVFGAWSLCQVSPIPAWQSFVAWAAVALGGGLGVLFGHGVDHWAGRERELRVLQNRVRHEPGAPEPDDR